MMQLEAPAMPRTPKTYQVTGNATGTSDAAGYATVEKTLTGHTAGTSHAAGEADLQRETWHDWFPDAEPKLTIEDLVERVRAMAIGGTDSVTIDKVRYWQREGVLPAPIRRKPGDAPGKARALYPELAIMPVLQVCLMRHHGVPLRKIRPLLTPRQFSNAETEIAEPLREAVAKAATSEGQRVGSPIHEAEVTFTDARGRKHSRVFTLTPEPEFDVFALNAEPEPDPS